MNKSLVIIALVGLSLTGIIWGSVRDKKATNVERQLVAMREEAAPVTKASTHEVKAVASAVATNEIQAVVSDSAVEKDLKEENQELLEGAATLKGTIASQKEEIAKLKAAPLEVAAVQAQPDERTAQVVELEKAVAAAQAELEAKSVALAAAEKAVSEFEEMKVTLANNVDSCSAQNQELSAKAEEYRLQIVELEKALEGRTKLLAASGEELARTRLNMNVLLSKIAAQNNSLLTLEESSVELENELVAKKKACESIQQQPVKELVVVEKIVPVPVEQVQEVVEEAAPAK